VLPPRPDVLFIGIGLLSLAGGLPMADRRIPPNRWYGVRIRETFADETIWYEVNAQAGRGLALLGLGTVVAAVALGSLLPPAAYAGVLGALLGVGATVILARAVRLARRRWRERGSGPGPGSGRP